MLYHITRITRNWRFYRISGVRRPGVLPILRIDRTRIDDLGNVICIGLHIGILVLAGIDHSQRRNTAC